MRRKLATLCLALVVVVSTAFAAADVATKKSPYAPKAKHEGVTYMQAKKAGKKAMPNMFRKGNAQTSNKMAAPKKSGNLLSKSVPAKKQRKAVMHAGAEASFFGNLYFSNSEEDVVGLKSLTTTSPDWTNLFEFGASGAAAYYYAGNIYCITPEMFWGYYLGSTLDVVNAETGESVKSETFGDGESLKYAVLEAAIDLENEVVYFVGYNDEGSGYVLSSAPAGNPSEMTVVGDISSDYRPINIAFYDGQIYGVTANSTFVTYSVDDATANVVSENNVAEGLSSYIGAMCYLPDAGVFAANLTIASDDEPSTLYLISPDGEFTYMFEYPNWASFSLYYSLEEGVKDPGTPGKAVIESNTFEGTPNLDGSFSVKLPSADASGNEFDASVSLTITGSVGEVNGVADKASYAPGETAVITFTGVPQAKNRFAFEVFNGELSSKVYASLYCGYDTPKAPQNVAMDETGISWDAVVEGVNNGYFDAAAVTYDVYVDEEKVASDVKDTFYAYSLPEGPISSHMAEVVAKCNGLSSASSASNKYLAGDPLQVPVSIEPGEDEVDLFTIVDANGDESTWGFANFSSCGNCFYCYYNTSNDADDWLIMPPVHLEAGKVYLFSMDAANYNSYYQERFEVKLGNAATVAAMTTELIAPTLIGKEYTPEAPLNAKNLFSVETSGTYYIGIHGISDADLFYLLVKNFNIEESDVTFESPAAPTELEATAAAQGALNCSVSFKMPESTFAGDPLAADATLVATVKSNVASKTVSGKPGETVVVEGLETEQGENTIEVYASLGDLKGDSATVKVFTGEDIPLEPQNVQMSVSEDNMTYKLTWEAPLSEGANGGYVPSTGIKYYLCERVETWSGYAWSVSEEIGTDVYEYEVTLPEGAPQQLMMLGVVAETAGGMGETLGTAFNTPGTPYALPLSEDIVANRGTLNEPVVFLEGSWYGTDPTQLDAACAMENGDYAFFTYDDAGTGVPALMQLPKVSTIGAANPVLVLSAYFGGDAAAYNIYASTYGVEPEKIGTLDSDVAGYATQKIALPEKFAGKAWVSLFIQVDFSTGDYGVITGYKIKNQVENDLALADLSGNKTVKAGTAGNYVAVVENYGSETKEGVSVLFELKKGGNVIKSEEVAVDALLAEDAKVECKWSVEFSADEMGECEVVASVVGEDNDPANNSKSIAVEVIANPSTPMVTDLAGAYTDNENEIELTWSAPVTAAYDGSFESEDASQFSPAEIGGFKNIDNDGLGLWGFTSWNCPNAYEAAGFTVWNDETIGALCGSDAFAAYDGHQYLVAICPAEGGPDPADDWLISPEVKGGSVVSFYMRAITSEYGNEIVELMASSTTDDMSAFSVVETFKFSNTTWQEFSATLPADAKYFALHYVSTDIFGVMIDAISFVPASDGAEISGYDIYRDGELIAENAAADCHYVDTVEDATVAHSYQVVPVLSDGTRGLKSNTALVEASAVGQILNANAVIAGKGIITVKGFEGVDIDICAADGKKIASRRGTETTSVFRVQPGIYVVRAGKSVVKVIVK